MEPATGVRQDLTEGLPPEFAAKFHKGSVYLIKERQPLQGYSVFNGLVGLEPPGLCVSTVFPDHVRQQYRVGDVRIVWLADTPGDDCVPPTALTSLFQAIVTFVNAHPGGSVLLFDGLERLISRNGFGPALEWVERLSEFVAREPAIVLVPFSPETVDGEGLANLERALRTLDGGALAEELAAAELSRTLMGPD